MAVIDKLVIYIIYYSVFILIFETENKRYYKKLYFRETYLVTLINSKNTSIIHSFATPFVSAYLLAEARLCSAYSGDLAATG